MLEKNSPIPQFINIVYFSILFDVLHEKFGLNPDSKDDHLLRRECDTLDLKDIF